MGNYQQFGRLFRRYRLRSEYETLADFADGLAQEGYYYDESLFSHWQKGTRAPRDRSLVLALCVLFCKNNAMRSQDEVNQFLASAGHPHMTDEERQQFPVSLIDLAPFLAPKPVSGFVGRETELALLKRSVQRFETILVYGPHGIGKTSIAAEAAHQLRAQFPDGVLWFQAERSEPSHILTRICQLFEAGVSAHMPLSRLTEVYRSIIWNKQVLIVLDDLPEGFDLEAVLPNGARSAVITTSVSSRVAAIETGQMMRLTPLPREQIIQIIADRNPTLNHDQLNRIAAATDGSPLLAQAVSRQLSLDVLTPDQAASVEHLHDIYQQPFQQLSTDQRDLLLLATSFAGSDVLIEAIASIAPSALQRHDRKKHDQKSVIDEMISALIMRGFFEQTRPGRVRLPPVIRSLVRSQSLQKSDQSAHAQHTDRDDLKDSTAPYPENNAIMTAQLNFYTQYIADRRSSGTLFQSMPDELDSIVSLIQATAKTRLTMDRHDSQSDALVPALGSLWTSFRSYYWHVCYWKEFAALAEQVIAAAKQHDDHAMVIEIQLIDLSRIWYYDQDLDKAAQICDDAIELTRQLRTSQPSAATRLLALARQRRGKIAIMQGDLTSGMKLLRRAEAVFVTHEDQMNQSHTLRYLSEGYLAQSDWDRASQMLSRSQELLNLCRGKPEYAIYQVVLKSHWGVLAFLREDYAESLQIFTDALQSALDDPMLKGTYTWLSMAGLALSADRCGNPETAARYRRQCHEQMLMLGITDTFQTINQYAVRLKPWIDDEILNEER